MSSARRSEFLRRVGYPPIPSTPLPPNLNLITLFLYLRPLLFLLPLLLLPTLNPTDVMRFTGDPVFRYMDMINDPKGWFNDVVQHRMVRWDAVHYLRKARGYRSGDCTWSQKKTKIKRINPSYEPLVDYELVTQDKRTIDLEVVEDIIGARDFEPYNILPGTYEPFVHPECPELEYNETLVAFYPYYPSLINSTSYALRSIYKTVTTLSFQPPPTLQPPHPNTYVLSAYLLSSTFTLLGLLILRLHLLRVTNPQTAHLSITAIIFNPATAFFIAPGTESATFAHATAYYALHDVVTKPKDTDFFNPPTLLPLLLTLSYYTSSIRSTTGPTILIHLTTTLILKPNLTNLIILILTTPTCIAPSVIHNFKSIIALCSSGKYRSLGLCDKVDLTSLLSSYEAVRFVEAGDVSKFMGWEWWGGVKYMVFRAGNAYKFVQGKYWDTGYAFSYWKLNNFPHFLLAAPMLLFVWWYCYYYVKSRFWKGSVVDSLKFAINVEAEDKLIEDKLIYEKYRDLRVRFHLKSKKNPDEMFWYYPQIHDNVIGMKYPDEYYALRYYQHTYSISALPHYMVIIALTFVILIMGHVNILTRVLFSHTPFTIMLCCDCLSYNRIKQWSYPPEPKGGPAMPDPSEWGDDKRMLWWWCVVYTVGGSFMWFAYLPFV